MKQFTTPGPKETAIKLRIRVIKARKHVMRANMEQIRDTLESRLNAIKGQSS